MKHKNPKYKSHLLSILLLPFNVVVLIPCFIYYFNPETFIVQRFTNYRWIFVLIGVLFLIVGLLLFVRTIQLFHSQGKGTLAPWAPPQCLVVAGPYRYVRNPMISAVNMLLLSEVFLLGAGGILIWQILFFCANHFYFLFKEEPDLVKRFGEEYLEYKKEVPRWIPDLRKIIS